MKEKYEEIINLHEYCLKIGVDCVLERLKDGYAIRFNNGGDIIQHSYSYGSDVGCVEPAIGSRLDYTPVTLKNAKSLVKRHKDKLNNRKGERYENRQADCGSISAYQAISKIPKGIA